jgi:uncharacterized NAD-dependent epimerase/dehydratase family protein
MPRLTPDNRLVLLMHDAVGHSSGKMGYGLLRYGASPVVAVVDKATAGQRLSALTGIPGDIQIVSSVQEALCFGPDVLVPAIAPSGGVMPAEWRGELIDALTAGLSLVNGLHAPFGRDPELARLVTPPDQFIWDIRQEPKGLPIGSGRAREVPARRVLFVGTDMDIGKMTAALELTRALQAHGKKAKFLATGQIGIAISGEGIPLDAIRIDFASGAVEQMVVQNGDDNEFLMIEGQGSLLNPASTATLPLMRGSMPTEMILVHRAGQKHIDRTPWVPIPPLADVVKFYEAVAAAAGAFPATKVVGIALNTRDLDDAGAESAVQRLREETGLPVTDVVRYGSEELVEALVGG